MRLEPGEPVFTCIESLKEGVGLEPGEPVFTCIESL